MRVAVFTTRSAGIGMATGVIVAAVVGLLLGAAWGLAVLNGLAAGALGLTISVVLRDGRFDMMDTRRRAGVWALAYAVMVGPMFFVDDVIDLGLNQADEGALTLLFGLTAFAAYAVGGMAATLAHLDGDDAGSDPHPYR